MFSVLHRAPVSFTAPSTPSVLVRREEKKGLPLVLFNYCFVVQDVQEVSPLLSLKTLESAYAL